MVRWLIPWLWMGLLPLCGLAQAGSAADWLAWERGMLVRPLSMVQTVQQELSRLPQGLQPDALAMHALLGSGLLKLGDDAGVEQSLNVLKQGGALGRAMEGCLQGERWYAQGDVIQADTQLKQALAQWPEGMQPGEIIRLRCVEWLARVKTEQHQFIEAAALYRRAMQDGAHLAPWRQSLLFSGLAQTLLNVGQWEQAQRLNIEAAALLDRTPDALAHSEVLRVEALLHTLVPGMVDETRSLQALEDAVGQARLADVETQEAQTLIELAAAYIQRGDAVRGQQLAARALELAQRQRAPYLADLAQGTLALALMTAHRQDDGARLMDAVLARLQHAGRLTPVLGLLKQQAQVLERAKLPGLALKTYRAAQALSMEMALSEQQAQLLALQTELDTAQIEHARQALEESRQINAHARDGSQLRVQMWSGGLALLVVLFPLMWRWYSRSRAAQRALAVVTSQLQRQSLTDALTGLPNRRHWQQHVAKAPLASGGLCLIDLDFFKQINDRYGHAVGDEVLMAVAQRLQDLLPDPHTVVRWGGEEFLIRVVTSQPEFMQAWVSQILEALGRKPVITQAGPLQITGSLGWAVFPLAPHGLDVPWDTALAWVDALMYHAKQQGRRRAWGMLQADAREVSAVTAALADVARASQTDMLKWVEQLGPEG